MWILCYLVGRTDTTDHYRTVWFYSAENVVNPALSWPIDLIIFAIHLFPRPNFFSFHIWSILESYNAFLF